MSEEGSTHPDPFDLERFIRAQGAEWRNARAELAAGRKHGHWMWFMFPQIAGLGYSPTAVRYAITSLGEARAYLADPTLGARLRELTELVIRADADRIEDIFGQVDGMKFRSCMTLFAQAAPDDELFATALRKYFRGKPDPATLMRLKADAGDAPRRGDADAGERLLCVVKDVFQVTDWGCVVAPGIPPGFRAGPGDRLVLRRPDGSRIESAIRGIPMGGGPGAPPGIPIVLDGVDKADVPIGTEVWMA